MFLKIANASYYCKMKLFVFGSTGDLVRRKVLPALQELNGSAFNDLEIIAVGRKDLDDESYRKVACGKCFEAFKKKVTYQKINFDEEFSEDFDLDDGENYFYIALPPVMAFAILKELLKLKEKGNKIKVLLEKPIGDSLKNARELFSFIKENRLQDEVFISDHYVFKKLDVDFENVDFEKLKIVSLEDVGLEGRVGYYNDVGALRDMVQSHFLNLVAKFVDLNKEFIENDFEILEVEKSQYIGNEEKSLEGYEQEFGEKSDTETFVKVKLKTNNHQFEFITGKGFDKKEAYVEIDGGEKEFGTENPYVVLFEDFFNGQIRNFPSFENSIIAWKITERILNKMKDVELKKYARGESYLGA
jgi:glucose-6-phosphate 1-dehydrogenase